MVASGRLGAQFKVLFGFVRLCWALGDFADRSVGFQFSFSGAAAKIGRLRAAVACELSLNVSLDCLDY
jgi:hypothetical protein